MDMLPSRILVPLDGSREAESILDALTPLARRRPVHLTLFHVASPDETDRSIRNLLESCRAALEQKGVPASTRFHTGEPAREILLATRQSEFDLLAMATHGRSGVRRILLGSVAEAVLRESTLPVFLRRPEAQVFVWEWKDVVVALDGSAHAEGILDSLVPLAGAFGATLHLLRVEGYTDPYDERPFEYLEGIHRRLETQGVRSRFEVRRGVAGDEILRLAESIGTAAIALTTHGLTGLRRLLMGSVAEEVLRRASCPVLIRRMSPASAAVLPIGSSKGGAREV